MHLGPQLLLVASVGLVPDEAELVGIGLDLGPVKEVGPERHEAHVYLVKSDFRYHPQPISQTVSNTRVAPFFSGTWVPEKLHSSSDARCIFTAWIHNHY
jgi:hypothetical protein